LGCSRELPWPPSSEHESVVAQRALPAHCLSRHTASPTARFAAKACRTQLPGVAPAPSSVRQLTLRCAQGISDALHGGTPPGVVHQASPVSGAVIVTPVGEATTVRGSVVIVTPAAAPGGGAGATGAVSPGAHQAEGHASGRQAVRAAAGFTTGAAAEAGALTKNAAQAVYSVRIRRGRVRLCARMCARRAGDTSKGRPIWFWCRRWCDTGGVVNQLQSAVTACPAL
jgi:hypothetical protein